jgi:hypothetical protein
LLIGQTVHMFGIPGKTKCETIYFLGRSVQE